MLIQNNCLISVISQWKWSCNDPEWSSGRSACSIGPCQKVKQNCCQRDGIYHHVRVWQHPSVSIIPFNIQNNMMLWLILLMLLLEHTWSVQQHFSAYCMLNTTRGRIVMSFSKVNKTWSFCWRVCPGRVVWRRSMTHLCELCHLHKSCPKFL